MEVRVHRSGCQGQGAEVRARRLGGPGGSLSPYPNFPQSACRHSSGLRPPPRALGGVPTAISRIPAPGQLHCCPPKHQPLQEPSEASAVSPVVSGLPGAWAEAAPGAEWAVRLPPKHESGPARMRAPARRGRQRAGRQVPEGLTLSAGPFPAQFLAPRLLLQLDQVFSSEPG